MASLPLPCSRAQEPTCDLCFVPALARMICSVIRQMRDRRYSPAVAVDQRALVPEDVGRCFFCEAVTSDGQ